MWKHPYLTLPKPRPKPKKLWKDFGSLVKAQSQHRSGTIGNYGYLRFSPQHRVLVRGWRAELFCGANQVLVAACRFSQKGK
jgi:hypothetical protein